MSAPAALATLALLLLANVAPAESECISALNVCAGPGPVTRPIGGCRLYAQCQNGVPTRIESCGDGNIFDELIGRCNWEEGSFCIRDSCAPTPRPTGSPTTTPSDSPTSTPSASPSASPSGSPTGSPSAYPSASPSGSPTAWPTAAPFKYDFFTLSAIETLRVRQQIESTVLKSFNQQGIAYPSTKYSYEGLITSLREFALDGIASDGRTFKFYVGIKESRADYGLTNLALFLATTMTESIAYDTCDEINVDDVADRFALSNACGQNNRSYQDEVCTRPEEQKMSCPVDLSMEAVSSGFAAGVSGRAPPPFFCRPKARFNDYVGYWDRFGGTSSATAYANSRGRTDVEGCCWWGRGALLTRGVCDIGKLNYYLGKRAFDERGEGKFPTVDFCADPEATCAGAEGYEEIRWVTGFFEWVERIQPYSRQGWGYIDELQKYVDGGMEDDSFVDAVSSVFTRGCHLPNCSYLEVTQKEKRKENFKRVTRMFGLPYVKTESPTFRPTTKAPTARPRTFPPVPIPSSPGPPQPTAQTVAGNAANGQPWPTAPVLSPPADESDEMAPAQPPTPARFPPSNENGTAGQSQPTPTNFPPSNWNVQTAPIGFQPSNGNVGSGQAPPTTQTIFPPSNESTGTGQERPWPTTGSGIFSDTMRPTRRRFDDAPNPGLIDLEDNVAHSNAISWLIPTFCMIICALYL